MADNDILIKRLSTIKLLYNIGLDQSYKNEHVAFISILSFHDSIEMFTHLVAEQKNIKTDGFKFMDYFDKMPDLTMKESMRNLNAVRVSTKHKGIIPSSREIEIAQVHTTDFFTQNTKRIFEIEFADISLYELIKFTETKQLLTQANDFLLKEEIKNCIEPVTTSFYEQLGEYKENKEFYGSGKTHFDFTDEIRFNKEDSSHRRDGKIAEQVEEVVGKVNKNFDQIERALTLISLGIHYRKYVKFKILTPVCTKIVGGPMSSKMLMKKSGVKKIASSF